MLLLIISLCITTLVSGEDCVLDIKTPNIPLVLDEDLNFVTSYVNDKIHFTEGQRFYLICPSGTVSSAIAETGDFAVCVGGVLFFHIRLGEELTFDKLSCKETPPAHVTRQLVQPCANNFTEIEVGIELNQNFIRSYTVCFDDVHLVPFYAEFTKPSYDCEREGTCDHNYNLFVDAGEFYNVDLEFLYAEAEDILGDLAVFDVRYMQLVPKRYFLNPVQWYPTFDYLNHVFNWEPYSWFSPYTFCSHYLPEGSVIYNGVLGVAVSKNKDEYVDLYLSNGTVPIPKWYWCVFYDSSPEVDGSFYIDFGTPYTTISESDIVSWWKTELCSADTYFYLDQGVFFYGNCTFGDVINPLLQNFIGSKWPGVGTTATTPQ